MHEYALKGSLDLWYTTIKGKDTLDTMTSVQRKRAEKLMDQARSHTHMQVLEKLTDIVDEQHRIRLDAPFIVRQTHTKSGRTMNEAMELFLESYYQSLGNDRKKLLENYRIVDVVQENCRCRQCGYPLLGYIPDGKSFR